ncbi:MAG: csn [Bacteroidetes bacterium]|nr:csn [Bacteroidota bacterium]
MDELQKKTAQGIVNIFETGKVLGEYGRVTLLPGDSGHLTYGRSQTTLASGNLYLLVKSYCDQGGATLKDGLRPFLQRLSVRDLSLDHEVLLRDLLARAGNDPVMRDTQDRFFDRVYWKPAMDFAAAIQIASPLGVAVVYDSCIHGSWIRMRDRTINQFKKPPDINENIWIGHYVDERKDWLATHPNALLHRTVYRMDAFRDLIKNNKWNLALPVRVRNIDITEQLLQVEEPVVASAHDPADRVLLLKTPRMHGEDVRRVQQALKLASPDGIFGPQTAQAVARFQASKGLRADGIVGPATVAALGL